MQTDDSAKGDAMIHLNGFFGDWRTWALIAGAWLSLGALAVLAFGLIARVGKGRERRGGK